MVTQQDNTQMVTQVDTTQMVTQMGHHSDAHTTGNPHRGSQNWDSTQMITQLGLHSDGHTNAHNSDGYTTG